jgi:hypothetical protein
VDSDHLGGGLAGLEFVRANSQGRLTSQVFFFTRACHNRSPGAISRVRKPHRELNKIRGTVLPLTSSTAQKPLITNRN